MSCPRVSLLFRETTSGSRRVEPGATSVLHFFGAHGGLAMKLAIQSKRAVPSIDPVCCTSDGAALILSRGECGRLSHSTGAGLAALRRDRSVYLLRCSVCQPQRRAD